MNTIGGRKFLLTFAAMAIIAVHDLIGLDHEALQLVVWLALGGAGVVALEDMIKRPAAPAVRGQKSGRAVK